MDVKTQEYHARISGFGIKESYEVSGPLAIVYPTMLRFMHSQVQLHGKHGNKRWTLEIQSDPFPKITDAASELDQLAREMFKDDIIDDSPLDGETQSDYFSRLITQGNTVGYAEFMTNEYFNPAANDEIKAFRADQSAIRFLDLDSGIGKDELAEEYGMLRNQLRVKYPNVWPTLNLRRS